MAYRPLCLIGAPRDLTNVDEVLTVYPSGVAEWNCSEGLDLIVIYRNNPTVS